jgi:4-cresol dehydrogenase (hydroxylating)
MSSSPDGASRAKLRLDTLRPPPQHTGMTAPHLPAALAAWSQVVGEAYVLAAPADVRPYENNVSGLDRRIPAAVRPASTREVQEVVRLANVTRVPLYPVSCGRNWGFGSRVPPRDDTVVLDLSRLNRIREINVPFHYAVVEPGVTQRQLYARLTADRLPLLFNVTGAAADTSVIGNTLERGIGYFASRAEGISGLEVVLGNGELLRTGFGHFDAASITHLYTYGIGPSLEGLFFQSNFGVVTAAGMDLIPKPEAHLALIAKIERPEALALFVDRLADLRRREIVRTVAHIGNRARTQIAMGPLVYRALGGPPGAVDPRRRAHVEQLLENEGFGPWSAVAGLMGTRGQLSVIRREVRRAFAGVARVMFMTDGLIALAKGLARPLRFLPAVRTKEAILRAVEPLYGLAKGIPTDAPMDSVSWPLGEVPASPADDPDQGHAGLLYCVPFLPADGRTASEAMALTDRVFAKHRLTPYVTLNLLNGKALECVINSAFDRRRPEQVRAAHACNDELTAEFIRLGFWPYRVGAQSMALAVREDDPFWKTVRALKQALDPNHIIAPGRYNLV